MVLVIVLCAASFIAGGVLATLYANRASKALAQAEVIEQAVANGVKKAIKDIKQL